MKSKNAPLQAIVLLGGENSRFWPLGQTRHKALYEVGLGEPILFYLLKECATADINEIIIVRRPGDAGLDNFLKSFKSSVKIKTVIQEKPAGMADAIFAARRFIRGDFFVLDGNQIFFSRVAPLMLKLTRRRAGILTVRETRHPSLFGIVKTDKNGRVAAVKEKPENLKPPQSRITAAYFFKKNFFQVLGRHLNDKAAGLENAINEYAKKYPVYFLRTDKLTPEITLKYPWNLFDVHRTILNKVATPLPWISTRAEIYPTAKIKGRSVIGNGVKIGAGSLIKDSLICSGVIIGKNCRIDNSIMYRDVKIAGNSRVLYSIVDEGSVLGSGTLIKAGLGQNKSIKSFIKGELVNSHKTKLGAIIGPKIIIKSRISIKPGIKIGRQASKKIISL